jgi:hypothetical protein
MNSAKRLKEYKKTFNNMIDQRYEQKIKAYNNDPEKLEKLDSYFLKLKANLKRKFFNKDYKFNDVTFRDDLLAAINEEIKVAMNRSNSSSGSRSNSSSGSRSSSSSGSRSNSSSGSRSSSSSGSRSSSSSATTVKRGTSASKNIDEIDNDIQLMVVNEIKKQINVLQQNSLYHIKEVEFLNEIYVLIKEDLKKKFQNSKSEVNLQYVRQLITTIINGFLDEELKNVSEKSTDKDMKKIEEIVTDELNKQINKWKETHEGYNTDELFKLENLIKKIVTYDIFESPELVYDDEYGDELLRELSAKLISKLIKDNIKSYTKDNYLDYTYLRDANDVKGAEYNKPLRTGPQYAPSQTDVLKIGHDNVKQGKTALQKIGNFLYNQIVEKPFIYLNGEKEEGEKTWAENVKIGDSDKIVRSPLANFDFEMNVDGSPSPSRKGFIDLGKGLLNKTEKVFGNFFSENEDDDNDGRLWNEREHVYMKIIKNEMQRILKKHESLFKNLSEKDVEEIKTNFFAFIFEKINQFSIDNNGEISETDVKQLVDFYYNKTINTYLARKRVTLSSKSGLNLSLTKNNFYNPNENYIFDNTELPAIDEQKETRFAINTADDDIMLFKQNSKYNVKVKKYIQGRKYDDILQFKSRSAKRQGKSYSPSKSSKTVRRNNKSYSPNLTNTNSIRKEDLSLPSKVVEAVDKKINTLKIKDPVLQEQVTQVALEKVAEVISVNSQGDVKNIDELVENVVDVVMDVVDVNESPVRLIEPPPKQPSPQKQLSPEVNNAVERLSASVQQEVKQQTKNLPLDHNNAKELAKNVKHYFGNMIETFVKENPDPIAYIKKAQLNVKTIAQQLIAPHLSPSKSHQHFSPSKSNNITKKNMTPAEVKKNNEYVTRNADFLLAMQNIGNTREARMRSSGRKNNSSAGRKNNSSAGRKNNSSAGRKSARNSSAKIRRNNANLFQAMKNEAYANRLRPRNPPARLSGSQKKKTPPLGRKKSAKLRGNAKNNKSSLYLAMKKEADANRLRRPTPKRRITPPTKKYSAGKKRGKRTTQKK